MSKLTKLITLPLRLSDFDMEIKVAKKLKWIGGEEGQTKMFSEEKALQESKAKKK